MISPAKEYRALLRQCLDWGVPVAPHGKITLELEDASFKLDGNAPPVLVRGEMDRRYALREMVWYLGRDRNPAMVAEVAKLWNNCRNPDGTVNSNYGDLVFSPRVKRDGQMLLMSEWGWAVECLMNDIDTRQAVMTYNRPEHHWAGNKDVPCTLTEGFMVRNNELRTRVHMRSSDLWYGLPFDLIWHQVLHRMMLHTLRGLYPSKEIKPGFIVMRLDSAHLYERHIERAKRFLDAPPSPLGVTLLEGWSFKELQDETSKKMQEFEAGESAKEVKA